MTVASFDSQRVGELVDGGRSREQQPRHTGKVRPIDGENLCREIVKNRGRVLQARDRMTDRVLRRVRAIVK